MTAGATAPGRRAVVLGGGIAGLLAARVLADSYDDVLVVDRDELADTAAPRRAAPQGHHVHGLLASGHEVIEGLFPGLTEELRADGVPVGDFGTSLGWHFDGRMMRRTTTGLTCISPSRPMLEQRLRRRVRALDAVRFAEATDITGLAGTTGHGRVTGVRLHARNGTEGAYEVPADLVVDATGRGSRTPGWLAALGLPPVREDKVKIDLTYTTCDFRGPLDPDPVGDGVAEVCVATPGSPRGATLARLADRYSLSLYGIHGDRPPADLPGFLAFAASLPVPAIHEAVRDATPLGDPVSFHYPASVRRRYESLGAFPRGLLVLGDAVCSFNPIYAQGMTVAALGARVLARHTGRDRDPDPRAYFRDLARVNDAPWALAAGGDLAFPGTRGRRSLPVRLVNAYMPRLRAAAVHDEAVTEAFLRVAGLVDPPPAVMRPSVLRRVLLPRGRRGSADTAADRERALS
ncbi:FAD-dependent oxidoreductase [Streptomyces drozdowiczii]|uniref:FAD-binding monooxygenase n=1 Tax=Streptomyces drozdowiczii TaxID=202862 RepID=A0ABY6Q1A2_9ACTN|nr:FAD-binding monooxygenase [Streptomyces drozdowiczii]MCX0241719.1 FAD-binding monooxygenase [Streptomyces drozdowiczii]UZK58060.1 FAD-binding monooxygenase [Streptomyces drozdowiczii]